MVTKKNKGGRPKKKATTSRQIGTEMARILDEYYSSKDGLGVELFIKNLLDSINSIESHKEKANLMKSVLPYIVHGKKAEERPKTKAEKQQEGLSEKQKQQIELKYLETIAQLRADNRKLLEQLEEIQSSINANSKLRVIK